MSLLSLLQFTLLFSLYSCQNFNFPSGRTELKTGFGQGSSGQPNPNLLSEQVCEICIPVNQQCDDVGLSPRSVDNTVVNTRIVNTNPRAVCPAGQILCCFTGTGAGGGNNIPPPVLNNNLCGSRRSIARAVNPSYADFGEYPWTAAIISPNSEFIATGALISPFYIVTTAHSIANKGQLQVRLGDYDLVAQNEFTRFPAETFGVSQVIIHPDFNPRNLFSDVALLRMDRPVRITEHIRPVCLPERGQRFDGARCWVAGFGEDIQGRVSRIIREVDVPIVDGLACQSAISSTGELGPNFRLNTTSFICAGGEEGKDSCRGDGGAPLVCPDFGGSRQTVVGMVAWGLRVCGRAGVPGAYVNLASFSDFIFNFI